MEQFDVVVVGAGAAGLMCAGVAGQLGLRVLLLDKSERVAEKIRISGGGRCNFTNRELDVRAPHKHFISQNPAFCRSALSRYTPTEFIGLVSRHGIAFHEKHKGQLFCDRSANDIIEMLLRECDAGGVVRRHGCAVNSINFCASIALPSSKDCYQLDTDAGRVEAPAVVVATGGLSIPAIGASDWGYRLAQQFNVRLVETRPGLVPMTFSADEWASFSALSGLSLPVHVSTGQGKRAMQFAEDLLLTHRGLSGPAVLQISSYWTPGTPITVDLAPDSDVAQALLHSKQMGSRKRVVNELAPWLPARMAERWTTGDAAWTRPINDVPDKSLHKLAEAVQRWTLTPDGTEGYRKAEVTLGGVDTRDLSSQTLESRQPGLYFIGEVVDVTGWLGGYNFQWAWASGVACAKALAAHKTM
jgi:predicted Rossmann fold flavoprotein